MEEYTVKVYEDRTEWSQEGKLHRLDGPAVEWADGGKEWWFEGNFHRDNGPAVEDPNGTKEWWFEGKLHRLDGPAIEWANGNKYWFVEGKEYSEEEFNKLSQSCDGKVVEIDGQKYVLKKV